MITVTENAKERLKEILTARTTDESLGLRLITGSNGQFTLVFDDETKDDMVIKHENSKILMVNKDLMEKLDGITIDREDTSQGSSLIISRH